MKNNKWIIALLVIIIVALIGLCSLLATDTISFVIKEINNNQTVTENNNENQATEDNNISNTIASEEKLKKTIEDQLFILFKHSNPITKKEDIDNRSKLLVALGILEDKYTTISNDINTTIVNVTKAKLEEAFNSSVISNLGIKHENFDVYELTGDTIYNRNTDLLVYSKEMHNYMLPRASKIKSYKKNGNTYVISMNYLFPDDTVGFQYYYGSLDDVKNGTNSIVKAYDDNGSYLNAQDYLDNNYNNIKEKLATYTYIFETTNNKIDLVSFSID